ncbi:MAG: COG4280 domain-containing protein [Acidimicrobiales bacterium]
MSAGFLVLAVFLACAVEAVEALTIVLAVGVTRGWRSTMIGVGAGVGALAVIIAALGPALLLIPLHVLQLVIGGLLLVFGLQWLRKAILRASGHKAKHDEASIFERQVAAAREAGSPNHQGRTDWYSFTLAFKGVLLEGLEVAFIVLTFGSNQRDIPLAVVGAAAAIIVVVGVGIAVRAPLSRVPENALKFAVGCMLTTFGTFWGAEGAGAHWPASDGAILVILAVVVLVALGLTQVLRRSLAGSATAAVSS